MFQVANIKDLYTFTEVKKEIKYSNKGSNICKELCIE